jgi:hypothetical protein
MYKGDDQTPQRPCFWLEGVPRGYNLEHHNELIFCLDDMISFIVLVITCIIDRQNGTEIIIKAYEYVNTQINMWEEC